MRNYIEESLPLDEARPILPELYQDSLLDLLNISETTVRLNRAGKLTSDQQNFVRGQMKQDEDGIWLLSTIFLGTALLLGLIFVLQGLSMTSFLMGGGIFLGAFGIYTYARRKKREQDLNVRVNKVKGELRLIKAEKLEQWALVIGDKFFPISGTLAQKFDGYSLPVVAAYYTEGTNTLLSIEVMEHEKRKNDALPDDLADDIEEPLASWEKPKNRLEDDVPPAPSGEADAESEAAATPPKSGRRF